MDRPSEPEEPARELPDAPESSVPGPDQAEGDSAASDPEPAEADSAVSGPDTAETDSLLAGWEADVVRARLREAFMRGYARGRAGALRLVRPRTTPGKLAVVSGVLLGTVTLVFAVVGVPHFFRGTPIEDVTVIGPGASQPPSVVSPSFPDVMVRATGTALEPGGSAEILLDGDGTFPPLWSDLASARHSVAVIEYFAKPGIVADSLAALLMSRARAGVDVRVLFDAFGAHDLPDTYLAALNGAGVRAAWYRPLHWYALDRAAHRTHARVVIIDDSVGYTGGFGIDDAWLGDGRSPDQWRETNVRFTGPAVRQLIADFVAHWVDATGELVVAAHDFAVDTVPPALPDSVPAAEPTPGVPGMRPLQRSALLRSPAAIGGNAAERLLALALRSARERLFVSSAYFVPDDDFVRLLADAARRGVDVRVLTNGDETDVPITLLAGRRLYQTLLEAGVRVFEYQPTVMHAKTLVVDGAFVAIGTINFDNRSLAYNNEVSFIAVDETFGAQLERIFEDDLAHSREIVRETFERRGWWRKLIEALAGMVAGFL